MRDVGLRTEAHDRSVRPAVAALRLWRATFACDRERRLACHPKLASVYLVGSTFAAVLRSAATGDILRLRSLAKDGWRTETPDRGARAAGAALPQWRGPPPSDPRPEKACAAQHA